MKTKLALIMVAASALLSFTPANAAPVGAASQSVKSQGATATVDEVRYRRWHHRHNNFYGNYGYYNRGYRPYYGYYSPYYSPYYGNYGYRNYGYGYGNYYRRPGLSFGFSF